MQTENVVVGWDVDNTLIDTTEPNQIAYCEGFRDFYGSNRVPGKNSVSRLLGSTPTQMMNALFLEVFPDSQEGLTENVGKDLYNVIKNRYLRVIDTTAKPFPNIHLALGTLKKYGVQQGIITSGFRDTQLKVCENTGITDYIEKNNIVTAEDSAYTKPQGELYKQALDIIGKGSKVLRSFYVGDTYKDINMVDNYNKSYGHTAISIFAGYGKGDMNGSAPDYTIHTTKEIPTIPVKVMHHSRWSRSPSNSDEIRTGTRSI